MLNQKKSVSKGFNTWKTTLYGLFIILSLIVNHTGSLSQVSEMWVKRYTSSGSHEDRGNDIAVDTAGNTYVTGSAFVTPNDQNFYTMKYSPAGVLLWSATYTGGYGEDKANSIAVDVSGNVYVTGYSKGRENVGFDYATVKYNSSGKKLWVSRYNGPGNGFDGPQDLTLDAAGNVYVTGRSDGGSTGYDAATLKYNSSGTLLWESRYHNSNDIDNGKCIEVDNHGYVYVAGISNNDYLMIKYSPSGSEVWVRTYDADGRLDEVNDLKIDAARNIYITGESWGSYNGADIATLKYNSSGTLQWAVRTSASGTHLSEGNAIDVDASGNVYVSGNRYISSSYDIVSLKYSSSGVLQWTRYYNGIGNSIDDAKDIALDAAGNFYLTGYSTGAGTFRDFITLKYDPSGTLLWEQRSPGAGNSDDEAAAFEIDADGNIYVTGASVGIGSGYDYMTVKYSQTSDRQIKGTEIPSGYRLEQNYPNPFNPVTKIRFSIPAVSGHQADIIRLVVLDALGREITTLVNQQLLPGTHEVDWDGSKLASGVYFYKLESEGFTDTKKMMMVK